jgi:hypothetical protein
VRASRTLVLALVLSIVAAVAAWRQGWLVTTPAAVTVASKPSPAPRYQSAWATEEEWLVDRITRDVRDMASYAATRNPAPLDSKAVKPEALRIEEHLFSPRSYEAFARETLAGGRATRARPAAASGGDERLLSALLDPRPGVLAREDQALSRKLSDDPEDAAAHERAALLLGAFALRDCAGISTDVRPALTRMTAHLALARALSDRGEPGLAGRYAEAALTTLVGRQRDALGRQEALSAGAKSPAEKAWLRALRLRTTGDWRIAKHEKNLTLLESLEEFRALGLGEMGDAATAWFTARKPPAIGEWARRALDSYPSMETVNRFTDFALAVDLHEMQEVLTALEAAPSDQDAFFEALNVKPGGSLEKTPQGGVRLVAIGRSLWGYRFQRNLVFDLELGDSRLWNLGLPGERKALAEQTRQRFGRLELFPVVLRAEADQADSYRVAMAAFRELATRSPELLTAAHWGLALRKEAFAPAPGDLPDPNTWFRPALARGTLLDLRARLFTAELATIPPAELAALREQAPFDPDLATFAGPRLAPQVSTAPGLAAFYGPLSDFNMHLMAKLSDAAWYDPVEYRKRQGLLCEMAPSYCLPLGYRLAELGFADEAAVAYQKGLDGTLDAVEAANHSRWLVDYYFDHGQRAKAEALAKRSADTYSGEGLFVMARLLERMERLSEAEDYYRRMQERYDNSAPLAGFYYRRSRVAKDASYEARLRDALARALPNGLEPYERATLLPSPSDGVVIKSVNDNTKRYGIQWGNVIVALDGFRVRDADGYGVVRALSQSPRMKLVVWRGKSYDEIEVELWDRQFRVDIGTYKPNGPPQAAPATASAGS